MKKLTKNHYIKNWREKIGLSFTVPRIVNCLYIQKNELGRRKQWINKKIDKGKSFFEKRIDSVNLNATQSTQKFSYKKENYLETYCCPPPKLSTELKSAEIETLLSFD